MKSIKELRWLFWDRVEDAVKYVVGCAQRFSDWIEKVEREAFREYYDSIPKQPRPPKRQVKISVYFAEAGGTMTPALWQGQPFRMSWYAEDGKHPSRQIIIPMIGSEGWNQVTITRARPDDYPIVETYEYVCPYKNLEDAHD